ncbi:UNVERIFIED_CONTAM: hypothetical protein GTU68_053296, partial [Idotea baltica]|nr:hypothetical protein [Idotea baltica]
IVIIPTYNEKENINQIVAAVTELAPDFDILVVDDSSPDGTGGMVKELQKDHQHLHLLERKAKDGLGRAYIAGFKWSIERKYDYICEMDADFSHHPKDLVRLHSACLQGADIAIGSRYIKGGKVKNWGMDRIILSSGASLYVRMITWMPIKDPTAGFKCYRREVLEAIDLDNIRFNGYAFQIEMKYKAYKKKFKLVEVPITFIDRVRGTSKLDSSIIKEAAWGVLKIRFV